MDPYPMTQKLGYVTAALKPCGGDEVDPFEILPHSQITNSELC